MLHFTEISVLERKVSLERFKYQGFTPGHHTYVSYFIPDPLIVPNKLHNKIRMTLDIG